MWVDKYKPKNYLELLSDERTNREILSWIQNWKNPKKETNTDQKSSKFNKFKNKNAKILLISGKPGIGKCLAYNQPVLMFDGNIKKVQDVIEGDFLMGDDSSKRTVISTTKGFGKMFRIITKNQESYDVNEYHILSLIKYKANIKNTLKTFGIDDYYQAKNYTKLIAKK
eukprot:Anaeramoba_ignava/a95237_5.p1 GENE.a95237_5~~a95237_5.p1  ORF type:complete len:190 (-),score=73.00 a95237_5:3-509(-)